MLLPISAHATAEAPAARKFTPAAEAASLLFLLAQSARTRHARPPAEGCRAASPLVGRTWREVNLNEEDTPLVRRVCGPHNRGLQRGSRGSKKVMKRPHRAETRWSAAARLRRTAGSAEQSSCCDCWRRDPRSEGEMFTRRGTPASGRGPPRTALRCKKSAGPAAGPARSRRQRKEAASVDSWL